MNCQREIQQELTEKAEILFTVTIVTSCLNLSFPSVSSCSIKYPANS